MVNPSSDMTSFVTDRNISDLFSLGRSQWTMIRCVKTKCKKTRYKMLGLELVADTSVTQRYSFSFAVKLFIVPEEQMGEIPLST